MKLFVLCAFLISLIGTLVLGVRLVRAGLRNRATPELVYGLALVCSGVGSITRLVVYGILGVSEETRYAVVGASLMSVATLTVMTTGLRLIYHPASRWPWALQAALVATSLTATWSMATQPVATGLRPLAMMLNDIASTGMMLWGATEALMYWSKLRRRARLGIADAMVVERFKLWGMGFVVGAMASCSLWLTPLTLGVRIIDVGWIAMLANAAILGMTGLVWAAFYPPESLQRRVASRSHGG